MEKKKKKKRIREKLIGTNILLLYSIWKLEIVCG